MKTGRLFPGKRTAISFDWTLNEQR